MSKHLQDAIDNLKRKVIYLGAVVEENLQRAVQSVEQRNSPLADGVVSRDLEVDKMEVNIEEECLKMLALYQPVAADLRFIVAVIKLDNDLERIGDQAVSIAEQAAYLAVHGPIEMPAGLSIMGRKAGWMVKSALDALVNNDAELARKVLAADDEVDALKREMFARIEAVMGKQPDKIDLFVHLMTIPRKLERIGDHASNIAEDVIYMVEGNIVRHLVDGRHEPE